MDDRIKSHIEPISASPIVVRGGCIPVRIVLYRKGNEFITHQEMLTTTEPGEGTSCGFKHHSLAHGHYFPFNTFSMNTTEQEALKKALEDFKERSRNLY